MLFGVGEGFSSPKFEPSSSTSSTVVTAADGPIFWQSGVTVPDTSRGAVCSRSELAKIAAMSKPLSSAFGLDAIGRKRQGLNGRPYNEEPAVRTQVEAQLRQAFPHLSITITHNWVFVGKSSYWEYKIDIGPCTGTAATAAPIDQVAVDKDGENGYTLRPDFWCCQSRHG